MDRFNVSDTFYHDLSMVLLCMPRSYMIKQVQTELNRSFRSQMHRAPMPHHGVYCSLTEKLTDDIEELVSVTDEYYFFIHFLHTY